MFKRILVPLDETDFSKIILPYVAMLAKGIGVPVTLLGVVEPSKIEKAPVRFKQQEDELYFLIRHEVAVGFSEPVPMKAASQYQSQIDERMTEDFKAGLDLLSKP